jgi:glycine dehydrogenase
LAAVLQGRPLGSVKYWPSVGRIDNVHGDRNLFCSCVPLSAYAADSQTQADQPS